MEPGDVMEYEEDQEHVVSFMSGLLLGTFIGAGVALLMAPQPGRRTRKRIRRVASGFRENATDRFDDLADEVKVRVDDAVRGARGRFVV